MWEMLGARTRKGRPNYSTMPYSGSVNVQTFSLLLINWPSRGEQLGVKSSQQICIPQIKCRAQSMRLLLRSEYTSVLSKSMAQTRGLDILVTGANASITQDYY